MAQTAYPDTPLFNIGGYLRIDGKIDPAIFDKAMRKVVLENDALRIVLHEEAPLPLMEFREDDQFDLPFVDFSGGHNPMEKAEIWLKQEFIKPFELYDRFLFRYALVKVSEKCYCYFSCQHHLIMDGLSIAFIGMRLAQAYNSILAEKKESSPMPSYKDFILDDKKFFQSKRFQQCKRFWSETYRDLPEPLIPRRGWEAESNGAALKSGFSSSWIKRDTFNRLLSFSREHNATPFHLLTAALYAYFLRTTNNQDFVFGVPVINRTTTASKSTMGLFSSATPIRLGFRHDLKAGELVDFVVKELRRYYRYQRFPLSEINRECGFYKKDGRQLFDLTVSYEKFFYHSDFNGSPVEAVTLSNGYEQNSLSIALKEYNEDQDVRIDFSFNLGAFNEAEIKYLEKRILFIMEEMVRHPEASLGELDIIPEDEKNKILFEWNKTEKDYPNKACAHNLFEDQAKKTPDATAAIYLDRQITYRELNESANQLARYLSSLKVGPETIVGICVDRSIDMLTGILGVMKAGGAYLPIDPTYPKERIEYMLKDSDSKVILIEERFLSVLPENQGKVVCLDRDKNKWSGKIANHIPKEAGSDNLAYVIYTSGSTGKPKGVMNMHSSLCNLIKAQIRIFGINQESRVLLFASFGFDASVSEIFITLCSGATLILGSQDELMPGSPLVETIDKHAVTHLTIPPSSLAVLPEKPLPSLKTLVTAGESCTEGLVDKWGKNRRFINAYGPTESTVCASAWEYKGERGKPPIGRPIDNVQLYILDEQLRPVPIGITGELHVGGVGLARGYLNRQDLTDEKFIPNPFGNNVNSRLYKTGDSARWLTDGNIEFIGRIDNQIKIRGYRVELEEIEAVLVKYPAVKEAAAIVRGEGLQGKRLEAYFIPLGDEKKTVDHLKIKTFLKEKLPHYMVPTFIHPIERFPLTPSGKIDRNGFPVPDSNPQLKATGDEQETGTEKMLRKILKTIVLGEEIGIKDDFFEAGMDSLQAIQLISHIEAEFNIALQPVEIFEKTTVKELGKYLDQKKHTRKDTFPTVVTIQPEGSKPPFFCVTAGYGDILTFKELSGFMGEEQPFYALQPPEKDGNLGEINLSNLAGAYIRDMKGIQPEGPYCLGGYSAGGILAFEMARQLQEAGEKIGSLILLGVPYTRTFLGHRIHSYLNKTIPKLFPETHKAGFDLLRIIRSLFSDEGLQIHLNCVLGYKPTSYPGKIILFEGRWASTRLFPWQKKWSEAAKGGLEIHLLPGNHDSFIRSPYVKGFAEKLKTCLDKSE